MAVTSVSYNRMIIDSDFVLSGADYHHSETLLRQNIQTIFGNLLGQKDICTFFSSIVYIGFDKKLKNVEHHNLFFDTDFEAHAEEIYDNPKWPTTHCFMPICLQNGRFYGTKRL